MPNMKPWTYLWRLIWISHSHFATTWLQASTQSSHESILMSSLHTKKKQNKKTTHPHPTFTVFLQAPLKVSFTETGSNEILLAGESELTDFTVGETLRLPNETDKMLIHSSPYKIISILHHAHIASGEWHFPGPAVKHGLLHMRTHMHGYNACNCLVPLSSPLSVQLPLVPFSILKQVKLF